MLYQRGPCQKDWTKIRYVIGKHLCCVPVVRVRSKNIHIRQQYASSIFNPAQQQESYTQSRIVPFIFINRSRIIILALSLSLLLLFVSFAVVVAANAFRSQHIVRRI